MLYKLLGMLVWHGGKVMLRNKYGRTYLPVPVVAAAVIGLLVAVGLALLKRDSD